MSFIWKKVGVLVIWLHDLRQRLGMDDLLSLVWLGGICIWGYINGVWPGLQLPAFNCWTAVVPRFGCFALRHRGISFVMSFDNQLHVLQPLFLFNSISCMGSRGRLPTGRIGVSAVSIPGMSNGLLKMYLLSTATGQIAVGLGWVYSIEQILVNSRDANSRHQKLSK